VDALVCLLARTIFQFQRKPKLNTFGRPPSKELNGASTDDDSRDAEREARNLVDEGNASEDSGRIDEAMRLYQTAVRLAPNLARAHLNLGNILMVRGDLPAAMSAFSEALARDPNYAAAHFNMGNAQAHQGLLEAALTSYRNAALSKSDFADAEVAQGTLLHGLGRLEDAEASYRRALQIDASHVAANWGIGDLLKDVRRHEDAVNHYSRALTIAPDRSDIHFKLGNSLVELKRFHEGIASFRQAIKINARFPEAQCCLGIALMEVGERNAATVSFRRALEIDPNLVEAHSNLGAVLKDSGQVESAVQCFRSALERRPNSAELHYNLANALKDLGKFDEAISNYRRAIELKEDFAAAYYNLGNTQRGMQSLQAAVDSYQSAIAIRADHYEAHNNLGNALLDLGRFDSAMSSYEHALSLKPDFAMALSNRLFCLSHLPSTTPEQLLAEHVRFGEQFESPLRHEWPVHTNSREPERRLNVGFVSGDLHDHAVAYFMEPLLVQLAGRPSLSLHAYYSHRFEDSVTTRLRGNFNHWHAVSHLSDSALAHKIRADGIDILVDLSGHTGDTRLLAFARKPAPVQASWIGYPGTTGLRSMDYYLCDRHFVPHEQFESQFIEKLAYLPASVAFLPSKTSPDVNALPAMANGYVTFGSFNRLSKLSHTVVKLWAALMRAVPNSRMLIGALPRDGNPELLVDWFGQEGIGRERLSLHPRCDITTYLATHHQIDICLDTTPYSGGTTTYHALWMGVPTLTLAGNTPAGRQGAAILGAVALEGFIATDAEDFVRKGLHWTSNIEALAAVRTSLRRRYELSPIGDPARIASGLERALRMMWQRYCADLPAETIDAGR
jgi:protein O-GlcNAc transferase